MMILNLESLGVTPAEVALSPGGVAVDAASGQSPPGLFAAIVAGQSELMKLANTGDVLSENAEAAQVTEDALSDIVAGLTTESDGGEGETSALFAAFAGKPDSPPSPVAHAHVVLQSEAVQNGQPAQSALVSTSNVVQTATPKGGEAAHAIASGSDPPVEPVPLESRANVVTLPSRAAPQAVEAVQAAAKPEVTTPTPPGLEQAQATPSRDGTVPQAQAPAKPNAQSLRVDAAQVTVVDEAAAQTVSTATDAQARATRAQQALNRPQPQPQATAHLVQAEGHEHVARPTVSADIAESAAAQRVTTTTAQAAIGDLAANAEAGQQQGQSANAGQSGAQAPGAPSPLSPLNGSARAFEAVMAEGGAAKSEPATATLETITPRTVQSVRMMVNQGATTMRVRLMPAHLGELHIVVESGSNGVQIDLSSASREVRESLEGQLVALRDQLARDGVEVTRINVGAESASAANSGSASQRHGPQWDGGQRQGNFSQRESNHHGGEPPPERRQREHAPSADSQSLNVYA